MCVMHLAGCSCGRSRMAACTAAAEEAREDPQAIRRLLAPLCLMYPQTSAQLSSCFLRPRIPSEVQNQTSIGSILLSKSRLCVVCSVAHLVATSHLHHIYSAFDTNLKSEPFLCEFAHKSTNPRMDETISILQLFTLGLFHYREASEHRIY